ncbi:ferrous iron transport protein B [uncultured Phascolarctobacterium sp.]|uniref:ferrous iron transport protein B n=1 Tax=uncultured Phascolarctobacterium sp. TaxID=512296 RepID=UPI00262835CB|nr:ferrous iron transport protein B [uncultured Phascolarctobacterium sp.]
MKLHFALVGNKNCGKSTLFNYLTGSNQHVGNFPGVTVQKKEGSLLADSAISVIDLPGIYSLSPYTSEEIVTRDLLLYNKPSAIINVIDATNIERSLYLTLQLIELNIPMIIALNMMDELATGGGSIDIKAMEEQLTIPVVPISANSGEGVAELIKRTIEIAENVTLPQRLDFCSGPVHTAIHAVAHLIEEKVRRKNLPLRFTSTKLIEGDEEFLGELQLSENERDIVGHFTQEMEQALNSDREAAMADMRYAYIEELCSFTVHKQQDTEAQRRSVKMDYYLTHKYLSIPIFIIIIGLVFYLTFDVIGAFLSGILGNILDGITASADEGLTNFGINPAMHSLIIDGIFAGVCSVLSFIPTIVTLFFFLSLLEDSGYMSRVAFVMDKLLRKIGLSGSSFIPLIIGFGCSVPAIMAARTLASERDRKMTIMLTPFMSCSAKLSVYGIFIGAFFPNSGALVMLSIYLLGVMVAVFTGAMLNSFVFSGKPVPFVMELPAYRMPTGRSILMHMWEKAEDFIHKAFTVIFMASIIVWFLQNFNSQFYMVNSNESIIAEIGKLSAPIFEPLGFGDWRMSTALITGITAKEVVISTLSVLAVDASGSVNLPKLFSPLTAYTFLVFCLLYPPCIASLATMRKELNSRWATCGIIAYELTIAWIMAFIIRHIGLMLGFN